MDQLSPQVFSEFLRFMDLASMVRLQRSNKRLKATINNDITFVQTRSDLLQRLLQEERRRREAAQQECQRLRAEIAAAERVRRRLQRELEERDEPWEPSDTD